MNTPLVIILRPYDLSPVVVKYPEFYCTIHNAEGFLYPYLRTDVNYPTRKVDRNGGSRAIIVQVFGERKE